MGSKRRRLALSCVECRKRKVKCDRSLPACIRCQKGGIADSCTYVQYDDRSSNTLLTPTDDSPQITNADRADSTALDAWTEEAEKWHKTSSGRRAIASVSTRPLANLSKHAPEQSIRELQDQVTELASLIRSTATTSGSAGKPSMVTSQSLPNGSTIRNDQGPEFERALLRGKSFKTKYYGPSNGTSLLLQFEELSSFVKEILTRIPVFDEAKEAFRRARGQSKAVMAEIPDFDVESIIATIPPRARVDALVQAYFDISETTYRVLHVPTFYRLYEQFWHEPKQVQMDFLIQLLLVMSSMNVVVPGCLEGFVGKSSVARENGMKWISICEKWLDKQSQKHTYLALYQIHVLIIIAKRVLSMKVKREYVITGNLLRTAMSAGLHREPTFLSKNINPFEQEMRRRLWFTILELELQTACQKGFPAWIEWDCLAPLNIHDEDFSDTTVSMPTSKPLTEFTRTSFLCHASQHASLRLEMLTRINSISNAPSLATVLAYDEKIRHILDSSPQWPEKHLTIFPQALSRLGLEEFLLLLHQPFATHELAHSRYFYSRCVRRNTSLNIMKSYSDLPRPNGLWLSSFRDDAFRACLAACHDIVVAGNSKVDLMQDKKVTIELMEKIVYLFELRVKSLGPGFHSYWIGSSALSLALSKTTPGLPLETFTREAVERVIKLHDYIMDQQQAGFLENLGSSIPEDALLKSTSNPQNTRKEVDPTMMFEGYTPIADPFSDSMFDFDLADIWNMNGINAV